MRLLSLAAAALFAASAPAGEPKLPANPAPPQTAYARAAADGKKVVITLKLAELAAENQTRVEVQYVTETRVQGGKTVVEKVPVRREVQVTVLKARRWRKVLVDAGYKAVSVRTAAGKRVAAGDLLRLLKKDTPVLVSQNGPVDPFYLQVVRPGTLVIVVPPQMLYQWPAREVPPDGGVPNAPPGYPKP
jgi:hypothetical protein